MTAWVPMPCPVEGCGYIAQFQLDKSEDADPLQRSDILYGLSAEHPDHPGGLESIMTTDPVDD